MMMGLDILLEKFAEFEPRTKMMIRFGSIFMVIIVLVFAFDNSAPEQDISLDTPNVTGVFSSGNEEITMQTLATQVANLQEKLNLTTQQNSTQAATINRLNDTLQSLSNSDTNLKNLYELSRKQQLLETKISQLSTEMQSRPVQNNSNNAAQPIFSIEDDGALAVSSTGTMTLPGEGESGPADKKVSTEDKMLDLTARNNPQPVPHYAPPAKSRDKLPHEYDGNPINDNPTKLPKDPSYDFLVRSNDGKATEFNEPSSPDDETNMFIRNGETTITKSRVVTSISHEKDQSPSANVSQSEDKWYIPKRLLPGALIPVTLITGVDAPTGSQSSENVVSATFRVTGPAIMPNGKRVDLTGCYVTSQVKGSLSNERGFFRPDLITCDFSAGQVKSTIKGYVTSPVDGSVGIRGRLVSRAGDLLFNATLVGAIEGLSNAFGGNNSNTGTSNIFSGGEPFSLPDSSVAARAAGTSAITGATQAIQKYYQERLEAIYAIIEIRPLVPASIHLLDEMTIKLLEPVEPQKLVDPMEKINNANKSTQTPRRAAPRPANI